MDYFFEPFGSVKGLLGGSEIDSLLEFMYMYVLYFWFFLVFENVQ